MMLKGSAIVSKACSPFRAFSAFTISKPLPGPMAQAFTFRAFGAGLAVRFKQTEVRERLSRWSQDALLKSLACDVKTTCGFAASVAVSLRLTGNLIIDRGYASNDRGIASSKKGRLAVSQRLTARKAAEPLNDCRLTFCAASHDASRELPRGKKVETKSWCF